MRNRLLATVVMTALVFLFYGCTGAATTTEAGIDTTYEPDTNYMALMIQAATNGDREELESLNDARNAKLEDMGMQDEQLETLEFLVNFKQYAGFDLYTDYKSRIIECCVRGDMIGGDQFTREYFNKQVALGADYDYFVFSDFFLLAKIIHNEAGSEWLSQEWKMKVGEVLLNRVASPEFPNTVEACVYQRGQYSGSVTSRFKQMLPNEGSATAALRLMLGERIINDPAVVFQSNFRGGSRLYERMYDNTLGFTYLCYSYHPEYYK